LSIDEIVLCALVEVKYPGKEMKADVHGTDKVKTGVGGSSRREVLRVWGKERTLGVGACPHRASKLQKLRCMTLRDGLLQSKKAVKEISSTLRDCR
jgi:hypothetical protein